MKLTIQVTSDDVHKGIRKSTGSCPIAMACRRLGFIPQIGEGWFILDCAESGVHYSGTPPVQADAFIFAFDNGEEWVQPFEFEIELRQHGSSLPGIKEGK